jgi:glutamine amidotransferase
VCRHLGYSGPPANLADLVLAAPHSLLHQSYEPREQKYGVVNADGFGVGWYDLRIRPEPAVYRSTSPIWADRSFASVSGMISSPMVIASVRSATPPAPTELSGTSPFHRDHWLFCHNGFLDGYRDGRGERLRREVSERRAAELEGSADSELIFALILDRLDAGAPAAAAVREVVNELRPGNEGGLNVLLSDGHQLLGTAVNNSLYTLRTKAGGQTAFWIASEPFDDDDGWHPVPDASLVEVKGGSLSIGPL